MRRTRITKKRAPAGVAAAATTAVIGAAYAAANTVPASNAGDGSGAVSGYTVTNVVWGLDSVDPTKMKTVSFNLAAATGPPVTATTAIKVNVAATPNWSATCVAGTLPAFTCTFGTEPAVTGITTLEVVAAN